MIPLASISPWFFLEVPGDDLCVHGHWKCLLISPPALALCTDVCSLALKALAGKNGVGTVGIGIFHFNQDCIMFYATLFNCICTKARSFCLLMTLVDLSEVILSLLLSSVSVSDFMGSDTSSRYTRHLWSHVLSPWAHLFRWNTDSKPWCFLKYGAQSI